MHFVPIVPIVLATATTIVFVPVVLAAISVVFSVLLSFCFACLSFLLKSVDHACEFRGRIAIGMPRSTMHGRGNLRVTLKRSKQTKQTKCEVGLACAGSLLTITRLW